jgi:2-methylcitrate dehydratase PrpD
MSAGARQNFGTMVKPLHAGLAAFQGISAVQLAGRGVTANESILDGPRGFFSLYRGEGAPRVSSAMFDMGRFELVDSGIAFKRFACCGCIHAALEATLAIADRHCLNARDIRAVQCVTNRFSPEILIHNRASTPAEARFCVEYSLAVALIDGDAGATQYTPERTADPVVQDLAARIVVETDDELPVGTATFPAVVTIETRSGESFTERRDTARGRAGDPLTWDDLEEKFRGNAACELTASAAEELLGQIRALPELDDVGRIPRAWRGST